MTENKAIEWLRAISATQNQSSHSASLSDRKEALYMAIQALKIVAKMKEHCEGSCTDCPYWNPKFDKCMNDLLKGV